MQHTTYQVSHLSSIVTMHNHIYQRMFMNWEMCDTELP